MRERSELAEALEQELSEQLELARNEVQENKRLLDELKTLANSLL